jgi:ABC-type lipoprotein release transport system permease subunit
LWRARFGSDDAVLGKTIRLDLKPYTVVGVMPRFFVFMLTRFMRSMLFGITDTDQSTFAGVMVLLAGAALLAIIFPAIRATKLDPLASLR